jgi:large subunit ribosomal protein L23
MKKNPYSIIKHRMISEKANMLMSLKDAESNACLKKFKNPRYVFVVEKSANKQEIKAALEEIYKTKGIKVIAVNTINAKTKPRVFKGRMGMTKPFKKAIVTLRESDNIDQE